MKKYIIPKATVVEFNSAEALMTNSLPMNDTPVPGTSALSRRRNADAMYWEDECDEDCEDEFGL